MYRCLFDRETGICRSSGRNADLPHDPATQAAIDLPDDPNRRLERWDGADGVRPARQDEIDAYDDEQDDREVKREIDDSLAIKAVVMWAAKQFGIKPKDARAAIKTEYKALKQSRG